jgi:general secretion pathway protein N
MIGTRCNRSPPRDRRAKMSRPVAWAVAISLLPSSFTYADELPALESLNATRQRPLFSPLRRPPAVEKPRSAPVIAQRSPPNVVLSGVIVGTGLQTALLKRGKELKPFPAKLGDDIDGWSVTMIAPRQVMLQNDEQSITLEFPKRGTAGPIATASAQPASPAR